MPTFAASAKVRSINGFPLFQFPRARQRLIIRIMKEEYAKQARLAQTKNPNSIHVPVTPQKYEKFRNEAERHGLTVPEWASEALDALSSIKSRS